MWPAREFGPSLSIKLFTFESFLNAGRTYSIFRPRCIWDGPGGPWSLPGRVAGEVGVLKRGPQEGGVAQQRLQRASGRQGLVPVTSIADRFWPVTSDPVWTCVGPKAPARRAAPGMLVAVACWPVSLQNQKLEWNNCIFGLYFAGLEVACTEPPACPLHLLRFDPDLRSPFLPSF